MKNIKTIIIILVVAGLGFFAFKLSGSKSGAKMATEALSDFAVKDTASIDKLILTDTEGSAGVTLVRGEGNRWQLEDGSCIQGLLVTTMLETIKYVKVKSLVPEGAIETTNKSIAAHHKKMEIYQNGKLIKSWYIGNPTQDQYGTYMLLKDPEKGKSPEPFIMHLPNMYGNLSTRFITNPLELQCTQVFAYDPLDIASVESIVPDSSHQNFKLVANDENSFSVFNNEKQIDDFDTTIVRSYLVFYRKIHFENHNYVLSEDQVDSLKKSTPIHEITVTTKNGESNKIRMFKRKLDYEKYGLDGELIVYDQDRLWVELEDGTVVSGQYYVFDKLMRNLEFFQGKLY